MGSYSKILDSEKYRLLVDDLKKCWDFLNPQLPFEMSGKDGVQIRQFLSGHRQWVQGDWLTALRNRVISVVNSTVTHRVRNRYGFGWEDWTTTRRGRWIVEQATIEGNGNGKAAEIANRNRRM